MGNDAWHTTIRLTATERDAADKLAEALALDPTIRAVSRGSGVSRHAVLRLAVDLGLAELRRKHLAPTTPEERRAVFADLMEHLKASREKVTP
jgi:hypothetical protein